MTHRVLTIRKPAILDALKGVEKMRKASPWAAVRKNFWSNLKEKNFTGMFTDYKGVGIKKRSTITTVGLALAFEAFKDKAVMDQLQALKKEGFTHITVNSRGELIAEKINGPTDYMKSGPKTQYTNSHHVSLVEIFNIVKDHKGAKIRADLEAAGTPIGFVKPKTP